MPSKDEMSEVYHDGRNTVVPSEPRFITIDKKNLLTYFLQASCFSKWKSPLISVRNYVRDQLVYSRPMLLSCSVLTC